MTSEAGISSSVSRRPWRAKDYLCTPEGFYFAVVSRQLETERIPATLRYLKRRSGFQKVSSGEATEFLREEAPAYWHYSPQRDCHLAGVPITRVERHFYPEATLSHVLEQRACYAASLQESLQGIVDQFTTSDVDLKHLGLTGSLLIGAAKKGSDIDLVVYDRSAFQICRRAIDRGISTGAFRALKGRDWRSVYERRDCALDFQQYVWHERRKHNKAVYGVTRFDISLVDPAVPDVLPPATKEHWTTMRACVVDARSAYDWPARYEVDHDSIREVVSYTATYFGQAEEGERIEARGVIERSSDGARRLILGSSREASQAYLRVI